MAVPVVGARKKIDAEDLVRWAYTEELPKRGASASDDFARLLAYGTAIDSSHYDSPPPIAYGDPHTDALLVDYHVRSLEPMLFTVKMARHMLGHLAPYLEREVSKIETGTFVRRNKREVAGIVVAERTEKVTEVRERTVSPSTLISVHAKLGNRPHWDMGEARPVRVLGPNNKPVVHGITRGGRYADGAHSPLRLEPSAEEIARARFDYSAWWMGLMTLTETCRLTDHVVLKPRARPEPWLTGDGEEEAASKIHRVGAGQIPEQRQRHFVELPPLRSRHGKGRQIPLTTADEAPC